MFHQGNTQRRHSRRRCQGHDLRCGRLRRRFSLLPGKVLMGRRTWLCRVICPYAWRARLTIVKPADPVMVGNLKKGIWIPETEITQAYLIFRDVFILRTGFFCAVNINTPAISSNTLRPTIAPARRLCSGQGDVNDRSGHSECQSHGLNAKFLPDELPTW